MVTIVDTKGYEMCPTSHTAALAAVAKGDLARIARDVYQLTSDRPATSASAEVIARAKRRVYLAKQAGRR